MSGREKVLLGVALVCAVVVLGKEALPDSVWLTVTSLLIGGAISAVVSWYFYKQAGDELREEAASLRYYVDALISFLEARGAIDEVPRDDQGRPIRTQIIRQREGIPPPDPQIGGGTLEQGDPPKEPPTPEEPS